MNSILAQAKTNNLGWAVFPLARRNPAFCHEFSGLDSPGCRYIFFDVEVPGFATHLLEQEKGVC